MSETVIVLRIYLGRKSHAPSSGFWGRVFPTPLSLHLVEQAREAGVLHAAVGHGQLGFASGTDRLAVVNPEEAALSLPVCVELVGTETILDAFVATNRAALGRALVVRFTGVDIVETTSGARQCQDER